jgi:hypothetical protein
MTAEYFRLSALSLEDAEEGSHMSFWLLYVCWPTRILLNFPQV